MFKVEINEQKYKTRMTQPRLKQFLIISVCTLINISMSISLIKIVMQNDGFSLSILIKFQIIHL